MLPYFLRMRLNKAPEMRQAVEKAYRAHYDGFASILTDLMGSKDAQEKQVGQTLAGQEYENLYTALEMDLEAKGSIFKTRHALSMYLDSTQEQERGLEMGQMVLAGLEGYSAEVLKGPIGSEMVGVIDDIARRQLLLKQYAEAEKTYQRALSLGEDLTFLDTKSKALGRAGHLPPAGQRGLGAEEMAAGRGVLPEGSRDQNRVQGSLSPGQHLWSAGHCGPGAEEMAAGRGVLPEGSSDLCRVQGSLRAGPHLLPTGHCGPGAEEMAAGQRSTTRRV